MYALALAHSLRTARETRIRHAEIHEAIVGLSLAVRVYSPTLALTSRLPILPRFTTTRRVFRNNLMDFFANRFLLRFIISFDKNFPYY